MTDVTTHERLARLEAEMVALRLAPTSRRPVWLPRLASTRRRIVASLLLALLLTLSATAGVYAIDRFSDVPSAHFAHADINAIAAAGITGGCGGTNYCPDANVTRGQMAAFLHRSLGRAGRAHVYAALGTTPIAETSVSLTVPGATGSAALTNGFVLVNAAGTPWVSAGCPCGVAMRVSDPVTAQASWYQVEVASNQLSGYSGNIASTYLFPVAALPGTSRQFNVDAYIFSGTGTVSMFIDATALWVPFGSTGASTLEVEAQDVEQQLGAP